MGNEHVSICQIEIPVSDIKASLKFYSEVFGWKRVPAEIAGYYILDVPREFGFGVSLTPKPSGISKKCNSSRLYFKCQNPDRYLDAIETYGGKILGGPSLRPGYGMIWRFQDPDGHAYGLFKET